MMLVGDEQAFCTCDQWYAREHLLVAQRRQVDVELDQVPTGLHQSSGGRRRLCALRFVKSPFDQSDQIKHRTTGTIAQNECHIIQKSLQATHLPIRANLAGALI